jgi:hypothetical protein
MRSRISLLALVCAALASAQEFRVLGGEAQPWARILGSVGFQNATGTDAQIVVLRAGGELPASDLQRVERGGALILEGESAAAEMLGFKPRRDRFRAGSLEDLHQPKLRIVWERALELPVFDLPPGAKVYAKDRWSKAPLVAGVRHGQGAVVWLATSPGERGYERYPYLLHALGDLGVRPPFRSQRLWAFFDYSYRTRVDLDYMAERWVDSGVAALHVAAWHFYDRNPERDAYLKRLLAACHERGILVYAWLELPHVSEQFWDAHPEWREKTAVLQDAQLDWRKLMNLQNRDCFRAVAAGVASLIEQFDWDGVNLAELYFESLEGVANPARFTPMNGDVRQRYQAEFGADPLDLVKAKLPQVEQFLSFRADLAHEMQEEWLAEAGKLRERKPHLDVVLTHVDDRFDENMRAAIGADASRVTPLLERRAFTLLVEDPATLWHLGPDRYSELAKRYAELTPRRDRLAIDLNIVDRYQDVYPTKQQTGIELFDLVHTAAAAFDRVALYFEKSVAGTDRSWLAAAAASPGKVERRAGKLAVASRHAIGVHWAGGALVNGRRWPVRDGEFLSLPSGAHVIESAGEEAGLHVRRFSADLRSARIEAGAVELSYESGTRAFAVLSEPPSRVEVDGEPVEPEMHGAATIALPRGQHVVTIR